MADASDNSQSNNPPPSPAPQPQPSDDQVIQSLIGTETRDRGEVLDLVNRMVGADEFSNQDAANQQTRRKG